jgi:cell division protein FtsA
VIDAFSPHVKSIIRVVELAGGKVAGLVLDPLLSSRAALTKGQKDIGVAVVDIGHGTTGVSVYEENKLMGVAVFPLGAGNITNDIAIGLKIPVDAAEKLKLHYGYALAREVNPKESIELQKFAPGLQGMVSRRFVAEIIESRLTEIFDFVNNELKAWGRAGQLPGGVVLTGGGAKLPGITGLAKHSLKFASQIGLALYDEWAPTSTEQFPDAFEDPEYVSALGLVLWGADKERWQAEGRFQFKSILKHFLP